MATSINYLADLYFDYDKYDQAEPLYKRSLTIRENFFGPEHPEVATSLIGIAELYRKTGRDKEADELEKRASHILAQ
jgi:hypothetical protein